MDGDAGPAQRARTPERRLEVVAHKGERADLPSREQSSGALGGVGGIGDVVDEGNDFVEGIEV